ncbi:MAG: hypothetical protein WBQ44_13450 [Rhodococcus sp. (in: high G+C Gram-positive bacteria)]
MGPADDQHLDDIVNMPSTTAALTPLSPILGRWRTSGTVFDQDGNRHSDVVGTDSYWMLPDGHWIGHDVDVTIDGHRTVAHELIGGMHPDGGYALRQDRLTPPYSTEHRPDERRLGLHRNDCRGDCFDQVFGFSPNRSDTTTYFRLAVPARMRRPGSVCASDDGAAWRKHSESGEAVGWPKRSLPKRRRPHRTIEPTRILGVEKVESVVRDTPIHDELQNTIGIDALGVDRHAEQPAERLHSRHPNVPLYGTVGVDRMATAQEKQDSAHGALCAALRAVDD